MVEDRVDRRLAAILAGDIARYSYLMGIDEEGTMRQLKAHRKKLIDPKIIEHHGRIVKTTGDGMLVEFVSVVDAVRYAVDIQRGMAERNADVAPDRRIEFRIGINVGDIISDENDIYVDGVNVAARLQALAERGGILVSRNVHDQVRDKLSFGFEDLGEQLVKNIARPIGVQRVSLAESAPPAMVKSAAAAKTEFSSVDRPSIAVLPFANMSGDPEQEYFADGISEDIITGLSKLRWFVAAIEPKLLEAEGIRSQSRSPEDLGAWDMVIQANSLFWRLTTAEREAAIALLRRAVERYPDYAPAQSMLAFVLLISGYLGWVLMESQLQEAAGLAARAEELDPSDPWAHLALGYVAFVRRRTSSAAAEFQRALDLNPNFAAAHGYLGWALAFGGESEQAIAHLKEAIRMSPHDPQNAIFNTGLAIAHYLAGRFAEAVEYSRETLQQRSAFTAGHRIHCASLAQNGQIDEAREALAGLKEVHPDLSIAWIESNVPYTAAPMAKFVEGMRKAGLQ